MTRQLTQPSSVPDSTTRSYLQQLVRDIELQFKLLSSLSAAGAGGGLTVEQIEDLIGANIIAGDGVNIVYNDTTGKVTVSSEDSMPYDTLIDEDGSFTYVGKATAGSLESAAVWRIFRLDESASPDTELRYADGVSTFTKIWNNRATYSY